MTVDIATLGIRIDSSDARTAARDMENFRGAGARAEQQVSALDVASRKAAQALQLLGVGAGVGAIIRMADEYTKYNAQLKLATQSQREYAQAVDDVRNIAKVAQQDLAATGMLYARIANGTRELGVEQKRVAAITETVNLALKVSGATAAESASAQLQLSQAFASGTLRGEEFNAVNEAAPRLMKALADGIGVPVGALKDMASNGEITSKVMAQVLPQALEQLRDEAKQVQTIAGAFTVLKNNVLEFTGTQAQANGTVSLLTGGITLLAENLNILMGVVATVTAVKIANSFTEWASGAYQSVAANRVLAAANLATAQTNVAATAAALATAQAREAELRASVLAAEGVVALAIAENGLIPAQARSAAAAQAHTAALAAQTAAASAASVGAGVLRGALGFLGGPVGAVVTVLGLAATAWSWYSAKSAEANTKTAEDTKASTAEVVAQMTKQIEVMERRNKMALVGAPTTGKQNPLDDKLAEILSQIDQAGKAEGDYAKLTLEARTEVLKVLGGQYAEVTALIERFNKATADGAGNTDLGKRLTEIRERAAGVSSQYQKDLKTFQEALALGVKNGGMSIEEYTRNVTALAQETWKGSEAGKAATAATNKAAEAYKTLISSIHEAIATNRLELAAGEDATDSQKARIKLDQELASGKLKLGAAQQASVRAALDEQAVTEASLKLQKSQTDTSKFILSSTAARDASARSLAVEYATYGQVADARELEMVALKAQEETEKRLDDMRQAKLPITDQIIAQLKAEEAARTLVGQATLAQSKALGYAATLKTENQKFTAESLADPKARADALLAIDANVWQERIKLAGDGTEAQRILQAEYNTWYANQQKRLTSEVDVTRATELLKIMEAVDDSARQAAQGMADSFGSVGKAVGDLTTALTGYQRTQAAVAAQLAASLKEANGDPGKVAKAQALAAQQGAQAQIKSYGDMASAAKGFFSENSRGYKALEGTEKAYRAVEMAMAIQSFLEKSGLLASFTSLFVTAKATETAATIASVAPDVAASMAKGQAAAAAAVAAQATGDPYTAWARMAAMAAAMAALGFALSGGGRADTTAKDRQAAAGTGSVLGDSSAKSDSIARAIALTATNSNIELSHTAGMLAALKSIDSNIAGLGSLVVRTTGITGDVAADTVGTAQKLADSVLKQIPLVGGILGGVVGKVLGGIFGGGTTVNDTGILIGKGSVGSIAAGGLNAEQYTDTTTKGGWFSSDKHSTSLKDLGAQVDDQFAKVILGLADSVTQSAQLLGQGGDDFSARLNSFVVDLGKISLKGLTGDQIQKQLEAVFSKLGDDMAQFAVGGLSQFQKVGEGYFETLSRIAADYANLDSILASSGTAFGATGMASIAARERLIELAGGIDKLSSQASSFNENFLTQAEQLAPVQKYVTDQLAAMGLQSLDTRDKFKDYVLGLANSGALATEAGAQQYTALLALADAFAKTHAATVDLTKSEQEIADERTDLQNKLDELTMTQAQLAEKARNAIDAHNLALYDQVVAAQAAKDATEKLIKGVSDAFSAVQSAIAAQKEVLNKSYTAASDALQAKIDAATASVSKLSSLSQSLQSTLDSMSIPGQEKEERASAQAQIEAALAIAKAGGPLPDADALKRALSTVSKDASGQFSTALDYERDLYRTKNAIAGLSGLTDTQLSTEQQALETLKAQKTALDSAHNAEIAALDKQLEEAKKMTDLLSGISTSLLTLPDALKALAVAVASAQKDSGVGTDALTSLYQTLLGRAPDAAGLAYWKGVLAGGASITDIANGIMSDYEYTALHKVPGFATGGDHVGGLRVVGEDGPEIEATGPSRIFNASQTRAMLRDDNSELVEEVRALRKENAEWRAMQESHLYAIAKSARNTEDFLDGAVNGDVPFATKEVETA